MLSLEEYDLIGHAATQLERIAVALERIAERLEDVTDRGRVNVGGVVVTREDRP